MVDEPRPIFRPLRGVERPVADVKDVSPAQEDALTEVIAPRDAFRIALPNFEGPLDLLLHLIREHKLDILDIPMALITEKYLAHIQTMREINLDIAGEFSAEDRLSRGSDPDDKATQATKAAGHRQAAHPPIRRTDGRSTNPDQKFVVRRDRFRKVAHFEHFRRSVVLVNKCFHRLNCCTPCAR